MTTLAFLLVLAALAGILVVVGWRRVLSADRPLLFGHMLLRQGARLPELTSLTGRELGRAVRRCTLCSSQQRCSAWLEQEHPHESYQAFCPNAGFIEDAKGLRL